MEIFVGLILGFIIVQLCNVAVYNPKYALWLHFSILNRKPFTCIKCLNFWTGMILPVAIASTTDYLGIKFICSSIGVTLLWTLLFIYEDKKLNK